MKHYALLVLVAIACDRRETTDGHAASASAEPAAAQPATEAAPADDVAMATRWLEALRNGDQTELAALARYPFEIHDKGGKCKDQIASGPEQLPTVLSCLLTDAALLDVIRNHDSAAVEPLADVHLAAWRHDWNVNPTPSRKIITGYFDRKDARAKLDLWVIDRGVRAVWKTGLNGSAEVALATEWLDAVRDRDIERLGRVTSYPLEVRDTLRHATCGKRLAKGRDTLAAAVNCLVKSDVLHRAMVDTPASGFTAYSAADSLSEWIQPWWREGEHRGLQRIATTVATADGYEFDFEMLVAKDGVRTVWKAGLFESRE